MFSNIYKFYNQVREEAIRITWPNKKELNYSVVLVLSVILFFSLFFLILDYGIYNIIKFLLNIGK